jgi:hypothetical protein
MNSRGDRYPKASPVGVVFSIQHVEIKLFLAIDPLGINAFRSIALLLYLAGKGQALLLATISSRLPTFIAQAFRSYEEVDSDRRCGRVRSPKSSHLGGQS